MEETNQNLISKPSNQGEVSGVPVHVQPLPISLSQRFIIALIGLISVLIVTVAIVTILGKSQKDIVSPGHEVQKSNEQVLVEELQKGEQTTALSEEEKTDLIKGLSATEQDDVLTEEQKTSLLNNL